MQDWEIQWNMSEREKVLSREGRSGFGIPVMVFGATGVEINRRSTDNGLWYAVNGGVF